jgi:hypothetical protein
MSKKKLLNERTIRRFGGLAGIKPISTSNFLSEMGDIPYERDDEEEEEFGVEDELEVEEPGGEELEIEDEEELEVEEPVEGEGEAEGLVLSLLDKVKEWAVDQGVEMDVEGEEEIDHELGGEEDLELDMDMGGDEELGGEEDLDMDMGEEEETLEEMINSILSEDDEEVIEEDDDEKPGKPWEQNESRRRTRKGRASANESRRRTKQTKRAKSRGVKVEVISDEKVIKEVTKRVKNRLRRIAKAQARKR